MTWILALIFGSTMARFTLGLTYHYSNRTMNWTQARKYCQANYTDLVVIQSQRENNYLVSILPNRTGSPYYWIGITKKHMNETWTWVGNNSTWIGEQSWAENEPNNNHITEFCVEIYINNGGNRGKWNDEKCTNLKFPVCYKAQCTATTCEGGLCQETIDNITCLCEPGFTGDRCQTAVQCPPLSHPDSGHLKCSEGNQTFNSTCQFKCHIGFLLIGSSTVTCEVTGTWSGPRPTCASYKEALMVVAGCGAFSALCCICFCCMEHRKRKKRAQIRQSEEVTSPSCDVHG